MLPLVSFPNRHAAAEVHGDGRIAAGVPDLDPAVERRPAAAVNQDHRGKLFPRFSRSFLGQAVVSEDAGRLAFEFGPFVEEGSHSFGRGDIRGKDRGSLGKGIDVKLDAGWVCGEQPVAGAKQDKTDAGAANQSEMVHRMSWGEP